MTQCDFFLTGLFISSPPIIAHPFWQAILWLTDLKPKCCGYSEDLSACLNRRMYFLDDEYVPWSQDRFTETIAGINIVLFRLRFLCLGRCSLRFVHSRQYVPVVWIRWKKPAEFRMTNKNSEKWGKGRPEQWVCLCSTLLEWWKLERVITSTDQAKHAFFDMAAPWRNMYIPMFCPIHHWLDHHTFFFSSFSSKQLFFWPILSQLWWVRFAVQYSYNTVLAMKSNNQWSIAIPFLCS